VVSIFVYFSNLKAMLQVLLYSGGDYDYVDLFQICNLIKH
jgi:hypothetical protein